MPCVQWGRYGVLSQSQSEKAEQNKRKELKRKEKNPSTRTHVHTYVVSEPLIMVGLSSIKK